MSKRKPDVNNIIFEIDSEDLDSSSDDEKKQGKCKDKPPDAKRPNLGPGVAEKGLDVVNVESSDDDVTELVQIDDMQNGGKSSSPELQTGSLCKSNKIASNESLDTSEKFLVLSSVEEEEIVVDSPSSGSVDIQKNNCENNNPLFKVKFKNKTIAKTYKDKIKKFMLNLIKIHDLENLTSSDTDTDLELDIWPEDLTISDDDITLHIEEEEDNLFFVDTAPTDDNVTDVPTYSQTTAMLSDAVEKKSEEIPTPRRGLTCFNCSGDHSLRDCKKRRDFARIAECRKAMGPKLGRYHIEDEQKFGHLVPGRISGQLRYAMGLRRDEIPHYIYRMRMLGYPPGWLEEARISHSGILMFDSSGREILEPDENEGEIFEPGSRDKFDIKKIVDFPGFNVPASSRYKEQSELYGFPPISQQDCKLKMLEFLAPNAMLAYKRKKLAFFPSETSPNHTVEGQAEMELDDGEDVQDFPTLPPLPDEAPPHLPPPPSTPPPSTPPPSTQPPSTPPPAPKEILPTCPDTVTSNPDNEQNNKSPSSNTNGGVTKKDACAEIETKCLSSDEDDLVIVEGDKAVETVDLEDNTTDGRESPSLTLLEEEHKKLLEQLEHADSEPIPDSGINVSQSSDIDKNTPKSTPKGNKGRVKSTTFGTPLLQAESSYSNLPSDEKFAKDICELINFENLPNSTGKYEKISLLLKKVKDKVDRIHET